MLLGKAASRHHPPTTLYRIDLSRSHFICRDLIREFHGEEARWLALGKVDTALSSPQRHSEVFLPIPGSFLAAA
jgi:hypothetical protein